jgi:hypothetical protein
MKEELWNLIKLALTSKFANLIKEFAKLKETKNFSRLNLTILINKLVIANKQINK